MKRKRTCDFLRVIILTCGKNLKSRYPYPLRAYYAVEATSKSWKVNTVGTCCAVGKQWTRTIAVYASRKRTRPVRTRTTNGKHFARRTCRRKRHYVPPSSGAVLSVNRDGRILKTTTVGTAKRFGLTIFSSLCFLNSCNFLLNAVVHFLTIPCRMFLVD